MEQDIAARYRESFAKLKTRKKFSIVKIEENKVLVEEFQEICGQKEPKRFEIASLQEMDDFVKTENIKEQEVLKQLSGNEMPYR
jgi:hypothetical protein